MESTMKTPNFVEKYVIKCYTLTKQRYVRWKTLNTFQKQLNFTLHPRLEFIQRLSN